MEKNLPPSEEVHEEFRELEEQVEPTVKHYWDAGWDMNGEYHFETDTKDL